MLDYTFSTVLSMISNLWRRKSSPHLPRTEGPYVPGCVDLMTGYSSEGCLLRLYYPTSLPDNVDHSDLWFSWLPSYEYLDGFAYVLKLWRFLLRLAFILLAGDSHVPAAWGADVNTDIKSLPVIVFSHGLGGSRFLYSCVCTELASHGYLVAAIEHRDNSAGVTWYYKSLSDKKDGKRTWIKFKHISKGPNHYEARNEQVHKRAKECVKIVDLLERIHAGFPLENVLNESFELSQFKGRLDFSNLVMMGHSFGAATALLALGEDSRFRVGVLLDGWMFSLKDEKQLPMKVQQPLLFINTQTFQIPVNVNFMKRFTEDPISKPIGRVGYTIRATTHENQSDTPHLIGYWLNFRMKKIEPLTATQINNHLILNFLHKYVGVPEEDKSQQFLSMQAHSIVEALSMS